MTPSPARAHLIDVLTRVVTTLGAEIKSVGWDKRDPGRKEKQKAEEKLIALVKRHFSRQQERIRARVEQDPPARKATVVIPPWVQDELFWEDDEFEAEMIILLTEAARQGIDLFQLSTSLALDWTQTNTDAAKWAREYTYDLIKGINDTTREAVREAITAFVETPGMTIGDTMDMLQVAAYPETRARMIATTEITRSFAQGNQMAGEAMAKEWPDVPVVKRWWTSNDDRVCEICGPLHGKEVPIDEDFDAGIDNPPAHVSCRCWTSTTTKLGD